MAVGTGRCSKLGIAWDGNGAFMGNLRRTHVAHIWAILLRTDASPGRH